jgi:hypothetical protein
MTVNWDEVQKALVPLKDYEDCCRRFRLSFGFPFVMRSFNFSLPELGNEIENSYRIAKIVPVLVEED